MTLVFGKCFFTLRLIIVIASIIFATVNVIIFATFNSRLEYRQKVYTEEEIQSAQIIYEKVLDLTVLFWLFFVYHLLECLSNIFELVQMSEQYFMPVLNAIFSINGCYGLGVFIYAQILLFGHMNYCIVDEPEHKLIYYWVIIEVVAFYISCVQSLIVLTMYYYYQGEYENVLRPIDNSDDYHLYQQHDENDKDQKGF